MSILKTFESQKQHEQHLVTIDDGAIVTIDGEPVYTPREIALGQIILRLNAQSLYLHESVKSLSEKVNALQVETDIWKEYQKLLDILHKK